MQRARQEGIFPKNISHKGRVWKKGERKGVRGKGRTPRRWGISRSSGLKTLEKMKTKSAAKETATPTRKEDKEANPH